MKAKLSKRAEKFLLSQNTETRDRIKDAIKALPKGDVKPMRGEFSDFLRLRVGGFRVIFQYHGIDTAFVYDIGTRGDIYK